MPTEEMIAYCEMLRKKKLHTIPGIRKIAKARSEVLPLGALVLERLLLRMKPSRLVISVHGVRKDCCSGCCKSMSKRQIRC